MCSTSSPLHPFISDGCSRTGDRLHVISSMSSTVCFCRGFLEMCYSATGFVHSGCSVNTDITDSRLLLMGPMERTGAFSESFVSFMRPHRQFWIVWIFNSDVLYWQRQFWIFLVRVIRGLSLIPACTRQKARKHHKEAARPSQDQTRYTILHTLIWLNLSAVREALVQKKNKKHSNFPQEIPRSQSLLQWSLQLWCHIFLFSKRK